MSFVSKLSVVAMMAFALGCGGPSAPIGGNTGGGNGGGGGTSGSGGGGGGSESTSDFKKTCTESTDCSSRICLVKGNDQYGYCTKSCESFSDCPSFWSCSTIGNANGKYCVQ